MIEFQEVVFETDTTENPVRMHDKYFRPNTITQLKTVNFVLKMGGLGDYCGYMSAIVWLAKTHPHIAGRVYSPSMFADFPRNVLAPFQNWQVIERNVDTTGDIDGLPTYYPMVRPVNPTGCHMVDAGFMYYANINPPPPDHNYYPELDLSEVNVELPSSPYIVVTSGATTPFRYLPPSAFNGIVDHILSLGYLPVFLGKYIFDPVLHASFNSENDYSKGLNLIEMTSLLQAAKIIANASLIVGLDNGLLHLAGCTTTPMVFGYNIASPIHRRPRRKEGAIFEIYPNEKQLPCTFCQSKMRFTFTGVFDKCVYGDVLCLKGFLANPKPWCELIDRALG